MAPAHGDPRQKTILATYLRSASCEGQKNESPSTTSPNQQPAVGLITANCNRDGPTDSRPEHAPDPDTGVKAAVQLVVGAIGGGCNQALVFPLDVVKTKLQTFGHLYKGGLHCLKVEWEAGGVRAIYRGVGAAITAGASECCVVFMSYAVCQDAVRNLAKVDYTDNMTVAQNSIAGSLTGVSVSLVLCPLELVKCKLQALREVAALEGSAPSSVTRPLPLARAVYRTSGLSGLYVGFTGVLAKCVLGFGAMLGMYDLSRTTLSPRGQAKEDTGDGVTMVSGAVAGVSYWLVAYPFDVVKSRMQVHPGDKGRRYISQLYTALRVEGILGLYKGFSFTALRASIAFAAHFFIFEHGKKWMLRHLT